MDALRFKQGVITLQTRLPADLTANKVILQAQNAILLTEKDGIAQDTRRVNMNSFKSNANLSARVTSIQNGELANHIANLRAQQQQGINSTVSMLTISRIIEKKQEIERLQRSIQNNTLLAEKRARILLKVTQDIEIITQEISFIDDCLLISAFLIVENLTPIEIADYDIDRLYAAFSIGG
jgi:hypothetical protein